MIGRGVNLEQEWLRMPCQRRTGYVQQIGKVRCGWQPRMP